MENTGGQSAQNTENNGMDELTLLKQRATVLGIPFSNNIGLDTLKQRIDERLNGNQETQSSDEVKRVNGLDVLGGDAAPVRELSLQEYLYQQEMRLIRVHVTCMNPNKSALPGEIFTVANDHIGTVSKFIPFGEATENGYHIPHCLYRMLDARRFLNIRSVRDPRTKVESPHATYAREFAIEVMEPLTEKEIEQLKIAQISAGSIDTSEQSVI